ncbi:MAG TPA: DUF4239 domain-containing protein [Candidatus Aquilonibacter sp.]|nr:DUF4239 domain-containing protein [Candidatus Aquilonibacter sp.]
MSPLVAFFDSLPVTLEALIVIGGFVFISVGVARLVERLVPRDLLREHNDLTGFTFAVVGVIYAVLLGFVAIGVWERYSAAESNTYVEAAALTSVYRDAAEFPGSARLRSDIRAYTQDVITRAWPEMHRGIESSTNDVEAERIARDVANLTPRDMRESDLHQHMIASMAATLAARDQRLSEGATGLNGVMWGIVVVGGFITVAFTYLFGFKNSKMQMAMIGTLALLIGLELFLTMSLDYPFQGTIAVAPDAFHRALHAFDAIDRVRH